jgi:hypothetical protein
MKSKPAVTTLYPHNRLGELIARPGGIDRAQAIASAARALDRNRQPARDEIEVLIRILEQPIAGLDPAAMADIAALADRIVSLALLLEMETLALAAMRLCDLGLALGDAPRADPVAVHIKALRLLAPGAPALAADEAETVLAGLAGLVRHVSGAA